MSEYVPRTQDVRNCYVFAGAGPDGSTVKPARVLRHEFDTWLAARIAREAAVRALREAADDPEVRDNRPWVEWWLRDRAERIEAGEDA